MNVTVTNRFSVLEFVKEKYQVIVFTIYLILLAIAVNRHEPWMDEAQAWLLAKDVSVKDLLIKYLRYEGSPGLWHLILMIPAKTGLPYFSINIISALFSAIGVWLFIRYAPFPPLIKILYPFTFFVFYQYGVIARSYCLIAPVLFCLAMLYKKKNDHPYLFVLLLTVLANISAHTFLIAGSIAIVHCIDILNLWKKLDVGLRIRHLIAMAVLAVVAGFVYFVMKTPPDQIYANYINTNLNNFFKVSKRMLGGSLILNEFSDWQWFSGTICYAIVIVTLIWLRKHKLVMLYLLPLLLISTLFAIKYRNLWHQGVLFLLWVFVLWVSFDKYKSQNSRPIVWAKTTLAGFAIVLAVQVYWCIDALSYDLYHNYSASYSLARYIKRNRLQNEKIYVSGWKNISILPYFSKNIFYNHNNGSNLRFWNWSTSNVTSVGASPFILDTITCEQPDVVIFSSDHIPHQYRIDLPNYKAVAFFSGYLCWKTGLIEPECYLVFKKTDPEADKVVYQDKLQGSKNKNLQ